MHKISTENKNIAIISIIGMLLIFIIWLYSPNIFPICFPSLVDEKTQSYVFDAVSSLFSGLAFLGLIIALILQKNELEAQRKQISDSMKAQSYSISIMEEQAKTSSLQTQLEAVNHIINGYERRIARAEKARSNSEYSEKDNLIKERDQYEDRLKLLIEQIFKKEV